MFQTSESCIKLHAVVVLELLRSEQCSLLQVCVCVCLCSLLCVCTWMGQIQRTHFTAGKSATSGKNEYWYLIVYCVSVIHFFEA